MTQLKRKLYRRGSSFETTIPMPILFALEKSKKHNVLFNYDAKQNRWYLSFEEAETSNNRNNGSVKSTRARHTKKGGKK